MPAATYNHVEIVFQTFTSAQPYDQLVTPRRMCWPFSITVKGPPLSPLQAPVLTTSAQIISSSILCWKVSFLSMHFSMLATYLLTSPWAFLHWSFSITLCLVSWRIGCTFLTQWAFLPHPLKEKNIKTGEWHYKHSVEWVRLKIMQISFEKSINGVHFNLKDSFSVYILQSSVPVGSPVPFELRLALSFIITTHPRESRYLNWNWPHLDSR